jgi:hypothetical protein
MGNDTRVGLYLAELNLIGERPIFYRLLYTFAREIGSWYAFARAGINPVADGSNSQNCQSYQCVHGNATLTVLCGRGFG